MHLTVEEMIDFVSQIEINKSAIQLAEKVNGHARTCASCRKNLYAFQLIYDKLSNLSSYPKDPTIYKIVDHQQLMAMESEELQKALLDEIMSQYDIQSLGRE